ncbi:hypothetical protein L209DRAFT_45607 [Thermothelomyces heterothallicus CBS 203.75]
MTKKTYNIRHSLVVTDPTTTRTLTSLTRAERTGCRAFWWVWSYVQGALWECPYIRRSLDSRQGAGQATGHFQKFRRPGDWYS